MQYQTLVTEIKDELRNISNVVIEKVMTEDVIVGMARIINNHLVNQLNSKIEQVMPSLIENIKTQIMEDLKSHIIQEESKESIEAEFGTLLKAVSISRSGLKVFLLIIFKM